MPFDGKNDAIALVDKMISIIDKPEKWLQGEYYSDDRTCLWGAYWQARTGERDDVVNVYNEVDVVGLAIRDEIQASGGCYAAETFSDPHLAACTFNNYSSHGEVIALLGRVKERLRQQAA